MEKQSSAKLFLRVSKYSPSAPVEGYILSIEMRGKPDIRLVDVKIVSLGLDLIVTEGAHDKTSRSPILIGRNRKELVGKTYEHIKRVALDYSSELGMSLEEVID